MLVIKDCDRDFLCICEATGFASQTRFGLVHVVDLAQSEIAAAYSDKKRPGREGAGARQAFPEISAAFVAQIAAIDLQEIERAEDCRTVPLAPAKQVEIRVAHATLSTNDSLMSMSI